MDFEVAFGDSRPISELGVRNDRGSVTIWVLGLTVMILGFGGIALDFWRALATQRELAAIADAASVVAASGIDEEVYRTTGLVLLDESRATSLGLASIDLQGVELNAIVIDVAADGSSVEVRLIDDVTVGLLGFFIGDNSPLTVTATSSAVPVLIP